jgi:hypothetical protein
MDDERKKHGWAAPALLATALVLYVASMGPAALRVKLSGYALDDAFGVFYFPLLHLPEPAQAMLDSWIKWWLDRT